MPTSEQNAKSVGLPPRVFLYTIDQISVITGTSERNLKSGTIYFEGRSIGIKTRRQLSARNVAPSPLDAPDWRVAENELVRWLKVMGFKYHDRGYVS